MKMPALTIVLLFTIILSFSIRRTNKTDEKKEDDFWAKEREANFTRKKNLDNLDYVSIPDNISSILDSYNYLQNFKDKKMVNLNSIPNTELKIMYGAANINLLSEYDQNFSELIKTLHELSMNEAISDTDKKQILEYAIEIGSDIAASFEMLSDIYICDNEKPKLHYMLKKAENIKSFRKDSIIKMLKQKLDNE